MTSVLFLDIDGVLNSAQYHRSGRRHEAPAFSGHLIGAKMIDPDAVAVLDEVCRRAGCFVVVSSAWRDLVPLSALQEMLRLRGSTVAKIIGRTPVRRELDGEYAVYASPLGQDRIIPRGYEICQWLRNNPVDSYAIVDDDDDMVSIHDRRTREFGERFVHTDFELGLLPEHGHRLVEILTTRIR